MTTKVEAVYENGVLKLPHPLPLKENAQVIVTIQFEGESADWSERQAWLRLSEANLTKAWDNPDDDVFNELLDR